MSKPIEGIYQIPIDSIVDDMDHRDVDQTKVDEIARSFETEGIINPITVAPLTDGKPTDAAFKSRLVAGRHRLKAARKLGWTRIRAYYVHGDENKIRRVLIAENLIRSDLSPPDRVMYTAEYAELLADDAAGDDKTISGKLPKIKSEKNPKGAGRKPKSGIAAKEVAKISGRPEDEVKRDLRRGRNLDEVTLNAIKGTSLSSNVQMDALVKIGKISKKEQRNLVKAAAAGNKTIKATERLKQLESEQENLKPKPNPAELAAARRAKRLSAMSIAELLQEREEIDAELARRGVVEPQSADNCSITAIN